MMTSTDIAALVDRLGLHCQHSAHGAGRHSVQIFRGSDMLADYRSTPTPMQALAEAGLDEYEVEPAQIMRDCGIE